MEIVLWIILSVLCLVDCIVLIIFLVKRRSRNKALKTQIDYTAKIVHDLRTPIYAIDGFTLLSTQCIDQPDKVAIYLDKIKRISHQMLTLVNDSIDLAKLQNDKLELVEQETDLVECINICVENIEAQIMNKNIVFEKNILIKHSVVKTDARVLIRILLNLLSNALKYTPSNGTIRLYVLEWEKNETEATYHFEIQDTGNGISKEFQKHIFEPFSQEGKVEHTDTESSGLGMFIVKNLVEQMKGKLLLNSEEHVGTQFIALFDFEYKEEM